MRFVFQTSTLVCLTLGTALALSAVPAGTAQAACTDLPDHSALKTALDDVVTSGGNAGLGNEMWATIVDRDGIVCAVAFTGGDRGDQWPGSRVISAQKANTANAFSLPGDAGFGGALSSGNLYGTVLEEGSLYGLQFSNPVDPVVAYEGPPAQLRGGLGVSGDTSCTDHVVAWRVRDALGLDDVPGGVSTTGDDNLIIRNNPKPNTFEHPDCGGGVKQIIAKLPTNFPIGD
jgi:uncharacterized protein GlcG (DUF336 family)